MKNRKIEKIAAVLLCAALVCVSLAGCGGSGSSQGGSAESGSSSTGETEAAQETAASDAGSEAAQESAGGDAGSGSAQEPVHLTALALLHDLTKDPSEMGFLKEMEEEAGVEIEWEVVRGGDWNQVKATRFASGDIPDILIGGAAGEGDFATYNGLFLDMSPYINEELTPNIVEMFEDDPVTKALVTSYSGEIYSLPRLMYNVNPDTTRVLFINQQWLDNLGLEMPTTFSELKDVLTAFKEQDANGNGDPNDEIPLDFNGLINSYESLVSMFLGSLGIQMMDSPAYYFAEGGEVKCFGVDERFKLMMEYAAELYADGLINSTALTDDYSQYQSLGRGNEAGDALIGVTPGWEQTDRFGTDLAQQYVVMAPLDYDIDCEAGTYDTRFVNAHSVMNMGTNKASVSAKCENPEAAMRFLDRFCDKIHSVEAFLGGISDGLLEKTGENSFKCLEVPADESMSWDEWRWTNTFVDNAPIYIRESVDIEMSPSLAVANDLREGYLEILAKVTDEDNYVPSAMKYSADDQKQLSLLETGIANIIDSQASSWLIGEADIESTWDAYVQSINDAGLAEVLEIRQKAFDEYRSNSAN